MKNVRIATPLSLITITVLSACSTSPIQKMSAVDAVKFGTEQYFDMPSYRFEMNSKFTGFQMNGSSHDSSRDQKNAEKINQYAIFLVKILMSPVSA